MPPDHQQAVHEAFPELTEIRDDDIRDGVVAAWSQALAESSFEELCEVPWWPPYEHKMGRSISGVRHIRDVTQLALGIADTVERRFDADVARDAVAAGALVHDISKVYELTADGTAGLNDLIPHPHYAVHVIARAGLGVELQHIALAHTSQTSVEPVTLEARIVQLADRIALDGLFYEHIGDLAGRVVREDSDDSDE